MKNFNITKEAVISIAIISIFLFIFILIIRFMFYLILFILGIFYKPTYKKSKQKNKKTTKKDIVPYKKEEDELHKDKKKEYKSEMEKYLYENVEKMNQKEQENTQIGFQEEGKIVGLAKPVGFWTSLVLGEKLSEILGRAHALNNREQKGFWVSMLEAQARGLGRQKGHIKGGMD